MSHLHPATFQMRRILLICLIVLLPFQTVWSAAAAACAHEQTNADSHLGHHEAHHDESPNTAHTDESTPADGSSPSDHHHFLSVDPLPFMPVVPGSIVLGKLKLPDRIDLYPTTANATLERPPKRFCRTLSARLIQMRGNT